MIDTEASVKVWVGDERLVAIGEGNGPVNALDHALRTALDGRYPALERIHLIDFRVRVLDSSSTTGAVVRVLVDSTDGDRTWTTIGVDANVIEASWQALVDSTRLRPAPRRRLTMRRPGVGRAQGDGQSDPERQPVGREAVRRSAGRRSRSRVDSVVMRLSVTSAASLWRERSVSCECRPRRHV